MLVTDVELDGVRTRVRVLDGTLVAIDAELVAEPGERVVRGEGGALVPGLHDHHLHLLALAAALDSVRVGPDEVSGTSGLADALRSDRHPDPWVRAVGYHESVAGPLDRWVLDRLTGRRPVRVQHRSGALWVLNSAGIEAVLGPAPWPPGVELDATGRPTGRLWRLDDWLRGRLPPRPPDMARLGRLLARRGLVGLTDATPTTDPSDLDLLSQLPQRVQMMTAPEIPDPTHAAVPAKILLHDHQLPGLDELVSRMASARDQQRPIAVHCVTPVALALTLAALDLVGHRRGDRIEHGALISPAAARELAERGLVVVTQPNLVAERGDQYRAEVEPAEQPDLWRCRSLIEAGVSVAGGTDAPFGHHDPWAAVAAAIDRTSAGGELLGPLECLEPRAALDLFLTPLEDPAGRPRRPTLGARDTWILLDRPLDRVLADPAAVDVVGWIR